MVQQVTLPDGRKLEFLVSGKPDATPLLWFNGTPAGSYLAPAGMVDICDRLGLAYISISKPGYGTSTRHKGRRVIDTVLDAGYLLKHLGVTRFYVGGRSGGGCYFVASPKNRTLTLSGPYALGCAARLPGCIAALSLVGVAPYDAEGLDFLAGQGQGNIAEYNAAFQGEESLQAHCAPERIDMLNSDPAGVVEVMAAHLPEVDKRAILSNLSIGSYMVQAWKAGMQYNADGWVDDDFAFITPWGFDVEEIRVPTMVYQGTEDKMVPYAHGEWLCDHIPQQYVVKHLEEGEGHISIYAGKTGAIIKELISLA